MVSKDFGRALLAVSGVAFTLAFVRLAWLAKFYPLGFELFGIWRIWGGWILLWLVITGGGFILLNVKRS